MSLLNKEQIRIFITRGLDELFVYDEIDSTNTEARRYALCGGEAPAAFVAAAQTEGRGRMGRSFYSPGGTGIYFSLLLPKRSSIEDTLLMTTASAVAVRRGIWTTVGAQTDIKWVNDLYFHGKKVSGILCEAFSVGEREYITVGVGINLTTTDFPEEIAGTAGSLGIGGNAKKHRLAGECIDELLGVWQSLESREFMEEYRLHSAVLGKKISYTENGITREGTAHSIDDRGRLFVRDGSGELHILAGGEISVRAI